MAKYLRPRRGSTNNAKSVVLVKGEMFMEYPNGRIGMEPGRIIVGNGTNACSSINYQPNSDNSWQPFITDPALFVPRFTNPSGPSSSASASYEWGASTTSISNIGDGGATGKKLPAIIGAIKETLIHNTNSIANLANNKADASTMQYYAPASTLSNYYNKQNNVTISNNKIQIGASDNFHLNASTGNILLYNNTTYLGAITYSSYNTQGGKSIDIARGGEGWTGTSESYLYLNDYLTATRVRHQQYTFTFPTNASTYYEHYYYDIPYTTIGIPTTGITILGAFVANVSQNYPAFLQCVANAFRVYSKYGDIRGKTVTIRVIWEKYTTAG